MVSSLKPELLTWDFFFNANDSSHKQAWICFFFSVASPCSFSVMIKGSIHFKECLANWNAKTIMPSTVLSCETSSNLLSEILAAVSNIEQSTEYLRMTCTHYGRIVDMTGLTVLVGLMSSQRPFILVSWPTEEIKITAAQVQRIVQEII